MDARRSGVDLKVILAMGKEATKYVRTLVKRGEIARIEFDVQKRDKGGRLLSYASLGWEDVE